MARISCVLLGLWLVATPVAADGVKVDFHREIKPILSDRCFTCHGPDEKARKGKLRLDVPDGALAPRGERPAAVVPGAAARSPLYRRITASDTDERMPPPDSGLILSPGEIEMLRLWIDDGAEWGRHWAFVPLRSVPVPEVRDARWPRGAIDRFVLHRHEREGLEPAPETSRERWLRRASVDLTGLPPDIAAVDGFLADDSPDAHEKAVDRLLASPDLGERLALEWMDVARYADTHGYQADRYRPMWPWRDWVIDAFNRNLPYADFTTWQLAGDLLPGATREQRLATAFNRHHMQTEEGGSVEEEFRVAYVADRVNTFGTTFLGLTLECSRCHDHKYDPVLQREFYQLAAFFANIDESGQTSHFTDATPVPALLLSDAVSESRLAALRAEVAAREAAVDRLRAEERERFAVWLASRPLDPSWPGLVADCSFDQLAEGRCENRADPARPAAAFEEPQLAPGVRGQGLLLNGENGVTLKGVGVFSRVDPFSVAFWVRAPRQLERAVLVHRTRASLDAGSRGWEVLIEGGKVAVGLTHMWPGNALKVRSPAPLPAGEWTHVAFAYDGSSRASGLALYLNGRRADAEVVRDGLERDILYERVDVDLTVGQRFRDNGFKDGAIDELKVLARELTAIEAAHLADGRSLTAALAAPAADLAPGDREGLFAYYLGTVSERWRQGLADLRAARAALNEAVQSIPEIMAMRELPRRRATHVLRRGAYDAAGELVEPGTPAVLGPLAAGLPRDRLGLARWLTDRENPLFARVTVNRYWQLVFGKGLVVTAEDFGSQGALPTHPELLDWLALRFLESGTDLKLLLRELVLSATYRQAAGETPDLRQRDPENRLLARYPSPRLPAELLRDAALHASGLLVRKVGGPSVKPYQPEGLWEEKSGARYEPDRGEGLWRKSLYTFWKRTSPHPAMIAFDAAERNVCSVRRQATTTPLQALVLLNDPQLVEAARSTAERALREGGADTASQAAFAFRLLTGRRPAAEETALLLALHAEQLAGFTAAPDAARALAGAGEAPRAPGLAAERVAAMAAVVSAILSFDETVVKR
jgi:hypothetical protein